MIESNRAAYATIHNFISTVFIIILSRTLLKYLSCTVITDVIRQLPIANVFLFSLIKGVVGKKSGRVTKKHILISMVALLITGLVIACVLIAVHLITNNEKQIAQVKTCIAYIYLSVV